MSEKYETNEDISFEVETLDWSGYPEPLEESVENITLRPKKEGFHRQKGDLPNSRKQKTIENLRMKLGRRVSRIELIENIDDEDDDETSSPEEVGAPIRKTSSVLSPLQEEESSESDESDVQDDQNLGNRNVYPSDHSSRDDGVGSENPEEKLVIQRPTMKKQASWPDLSRSVNQSIIGEEEEEEVVLARQGAMKSFQPHRGDAVARMAHDARTEESSAAKDVFSGDEFNKAESMTESCVGYEQDDPESTGIAIGQMLTDEITPEVRERKRGFKLRGLKRHRKAEIVSSSGDHFDAILSPEVPSKLETGKTLRQRRPFGLSKTYSPDKVDHSFLAGDLGTQEGKKQVHLRLQRASKDGERSGSSTPTKERVSEKIQNIRRRLNKRGTKVESDADSRVSRDFDNLWDWPASSDESDGETGVDHSTSDISEGSRRHVGADPVGALGYANAYSPVSGSVSLKNLRSRNKREYRVKPYHRFAPYKVYMTEEQIYQNMLQPSEIVRHRQSFVEPWYDASFGHYHDRETEIWGSPSVDRRIGSLKVEVLSCVGVRKSKPDVSVFLICGDGAFATDIIAGSRSPMWPASSKRAACFPLFHAYARLYAGVFDVKNRKNSENDYFCGRVTIDIAALRPDTEYDVSLPLRASSFVYDRRARGVIRLRFALHWFSERAAVLSYLKMPRNLATTTKYIEYPSIPCADPKTFRNVAITVHGQELPGKYSRTAFRATMREFNLYQQNLRHLLKTLIRDVVFYENPFLSLYICFGWMHCVFNSSVRLAPVYFLGFLILLLIQNYFLFALKPSRNLGYSPLTVQELVMALLYTKKSHAMQSALAHKRAKQESSERSEHYVEPLDHREFPFSERNEYKKLSIAEALVRKHSKDKKEKKEDLQLQGRLSIYVQNTESFGNLLVGAGAPFENGDDPGAILRTESLEKEDSENNAESDAESEFHVGDDVNFSLDMDDPDEEVTNFSGWDSTSWTWAGSIGTSTSSSVVQGPPQSADEKPRKRVPPHLHLARLEEKLAWLTQNLSIDRVFSAAVVNNPKNSDREYRSLPDDAAISEKSKDKRVPFDDFDKRLGYRDRHKNPVTQIQSAYLGPLMRIFRVLTIIIRVLFNISIWTDPYLSFWILISLILLALLLIVFPWRMFFFVVGVASFGPQNFIIRLRMERKAAEDAETVPEVVFGGSELNNSGDLDSVGDKFEKKGGRRRRQNPLAQLKERRQRWITERQESRESQDSSHSGYAEREANNRKPFSAAGKARKQSVEPREIIVPYGPFRKERFYDWPPDPTVARATPISLFTAG